MIQSISQSCFYSWLRREPDRIIAVLGRCPDRHCTPDWPASAQGGKVCSDLAHRKARHRGQEVMSCQKMIDRCIKIIRKTQCYSAAAVCVLVYWKTYE